MTESVKKGNTTAAKAVDQEQVYVEKLGSLNERAFGAGVGDGAKAGVKDQPKGEIQACCGNVGKRDRANMGLCWGRLEILKNRIFGPGGRLGLIADLPKFFEQKKKRSPAASALPCDLKGRVY